MLYKYFISLFIFPVLFTISCEKTFSQSADFYNNYLDGNSFIMEKKFDKAIEKYNAAIKSYPVDYVYYNRGNAKFGMKDYKGAIADYDKTISLNSEYATAYLQRGLVKITQGDKINGCTDLKQAQKLAIDEVRDEVKAAVKQHCK